MDYKDDFLAWARECVRIVDKLSGASVPFVLNAPQRRVLGIMEDQRRAGLPIRVIMLKARQWGGSTLVQVYMAWMQLVRHLGWNSVICAHVKDASAGIRGMYSRLLREYPEGMKTGKGKDWVLSPYEKSQGVVEIAARDCRIALATAGAPNSVRGSNFAMAHLSEVAFWGDGDSGSAEEIVRTVSGSVPRVADSLVVMESTANGKDNYFYEEWQRAVAGRSDKCAVFVPWHEIEIYRRDLSEKEREDPGAWADDYELGLLAAGVAAEAVAWYHDKRREYPTHEAMMAEFPSTAEEAFSASGRDAAFGEDDLPERVECGGGGVPLVVAVPAWREECRALETFDCGGECVTALGSLPSSGTAAEMLRRCEEWCMDRGGVLCVATTGDGGDGGHARWFASQGADRGLEVYCGDDDEMVVRLDAERISELLDRHHALVRRGGVCETAAGDARGEYRGFRLGRPWASPRVLARLVALEVRESMGEGSVDVSSLL